MNERVTDAELAAAIGATEKAIRALQNVPGDLVDCDKISLRAMRELQERRIEECSFREALARIGAGFYTEKGAENHAKDIIRLVDSRAEEKAGG